MSTAPTTHDTPNENAHRMGARIKRNRLGSISKTSASATRTKATAKIFQNASAKKTQKTKQSEQTPSDFSRDNGRKSVRSASEIKIRGRTTRPTKDNANMPKIKSKAFRRQATGAEQACGMFRR